MTREYGFLGAVLIAVAVVIGVGVVVALIEDDEPTQVEAEEQFCDDVGEYTAAVGALRDLDSDASIEEFEERRDAVITAYNNMIASAGQLREARLGDLQDAHEEFRDAIDDIDDEQTFQEARDSVRDEAEELGKALGQVLNDVNCGSGQGAQERSDE